MNKQPEALRLADALDSRRESSPTHYINEAAAELRRLHAEVQRQNLYAAGADQLVEVWSGRAHDFMNSRDRLLKANRSLWAKLDSLRADLGKPAMCGQWIYEYPGDVFVVFDPMTDGARIVGAARTLREAGEILEAVGQKPPQRVGQAMRWHIQRGPLTQAQVVDGFCSTPHEVQCVGAFSDGVRYAERTHGIK